MRQRYIYKDENGIWHSQPEVKDSDPIFIKSQLEYLNQLDPLFVKAKEKSELQFILTLLRHYGYSDAGWDPFENFEQVYDAFRKQNDKYSKTSSSDHYALFMYGLIVEASVPYNFLANLLNIIEGGHYRGDNFPDAINPKTGRRRPQPPRTKIDSIVNRAKSHGIDIKLFDEFYDNELRNAIFHSDYVVYMGEVRILQPIRSYSEQEWLSLVNKALAYIDAFLMLYYGYIGTYKEPELIPAPEDFIHHKNETVTTIVRKGYGLIGIRDRWTKEELKRGYIPFILSKSHAYEARLISEGHLLLPEDRIKKFNNLPRFLRKLLKKWLLKKKYL